MRLLDLLGRVALLVLLLLAAIVLIVVGLIVIGQVFIYLIERGALD